MIKYLFHIAVLSLWYTASIHSHTVVDTIKTISHSLPIEIVQSIPVMEEKEYTFAVYIAARNNLERFVAQNLLQMMRVGTNKHLNIVVQVDSTHNKAMVTQRFVIHKNTIVQVGELEPMDSGDPNTLIDFCQWAFTNFPCRQPMLTLWSHGIGDLEITDWLRTIALLPFYADLPQLYVYNPETNIIEINRSISFLEYISTITQLLKRPAKAHARGICFDDITGHSITNHAVGEALTYVRDTTLHGKPFACLLCDACLMNSIGFMYSLKPPRKRPVARLLIGSQEAVLATGYDYYRTLLPLSAGAVDLTDFAQHVTTTFADTYQPIIRDYTQAAIALDTLDPLYAAIDAISFALIDGIANQQHKSVENFIESCSSRSQCTYFAEPSYKDMHHLFSIMRDRVAEIVLHNDEHTEQLQLKLANLLDQACSLIKESVIANNTGLSLKHASGISIYLPRKGGRIHHSYQATDFGQDSAWFDLLNIYVAKK